MPEISVVIPIYNVEKYLARCVDSVLSQTFTDFEIILVDDGSPDSCPDICDNYAKNNGNVHVIHKQNGGLSDARNAGLKVVSGKYVMFLDGDDYLDNNCFKSLMASNVNSADLVIGSIAYSYENSDHKDYQTERHDFLIQKSDYRNYLPALLDERRLNYVHGKIYKHEIIQKNGVSFEDEKLTSAEDTVFNFTFLRYCNSIQICGAYVHYYMQHVGLAGKFVSDRYSRFGRLSDFIERTCMELNLYNEEMKTATDKRRVYSAIWCKDGILRATASAKQKIFLLDEISSDEKLKAVVNDVCVDGKEDLLYLLRNGGAKTLKYDLRKKNKMKIKSFISKITPGFIKRSIKFGRR